MKASELIKRLQVGIEDHGDIEVEVRNLAGDLAPIEGVFMVTARYNRFTLEDDAESYADEILIRLPGEKPNA